MQVNENGLALIRKFEGFRARAYRDAVGVWTIGYGHTSMAGAPQVKAGLIISRDKAAQILAKDVVMFATGVAELVKSELNDNQFSALVSFAYNVGLGNFRKSSVLSAVNREDFEAVPRRLALWSRAGGRVLPGLVKRRAAEAALFATAVDTADGSGGGLTDVLKPVVESTIEVAKGKPIVKSKTAWSAGLAGVLGAIQSFWLADQQAIFILLGLVILAAVLFIIYERHKKATEEGV
jgi:lysozyme